MTTNTAPEAEIKFPIECPGLKASLAQWARWFHGAKPADRTFLVSWLDCEWHALTGHSKQRELEILTRWLDGMWALDSVIQEASR